MPASIVSSLIISKMLQISLICSKVNEVIKTDLI